MAAAKKKDENLYFYFFIFEFSCQPTRTRFSSKKEMLIPFSFMESRLLVGCQSQGAVKEKKYRMRRYAVRDTRYEKKQKRREEEEGCAEEGLLKRKDFCPKGKTARRPSTFTFSLRMEG